MPMFRKKPILIEAMKWDGSLAVAHDIVAWSAGAVGIDRDVGCLVVKTLEGDMVGDVGDFIIKGVKGEYYPCKPDIFEASYDPEA